MTTTRPGRGPNPTVRTRRIGNELRVLRKGLGFTAEQVAKEIACSPSRISRIESGEIRIRPGDVHELLDVYGATDEVRRELVALARHLKDEGWWHPYGDVLSRRYLTYIAMEAEAKAQRSFEPIVIPGLLQTEGYARAVIEVGRERPAEPETVEKLVAVRNIRQRLLVREQPLELSVVVDEACLRRVIGGPGAMRAQLAHLSTMASRPNVTIRVLPALCGTHPSLAGSFAILDFSDPGDRSIGYTETTVGDLCIDDEREVEALTMVFDRLRDQALAPEESIDLIGQVAAGL